MVPFLIKKLQDHPSEVGETYWQHFCHASLFSARLFLAGGVCFIHAILPCCFKTTGSLAVKQLQSSMVTNRSSRTTGRQENSGALPSGLSAEIEGQCLQLVNLKQQCEKLLKERMHQAQLLLTSFISEPVQEKKCSVCQRLNFSGSSSSVGH